MDYVFSNRTKKITLGTAIVGLVLFLIAVFTDNADNYGTLHNGLNQRIWSSVLINGFFFFAISLSMLFFLALQYASEASWTIVFKRIFEAMISVLPWMALVVVIVLAAGHFFHAHHLYHWMDSEAVAHDHLLEHKSLYFGKLFYWSRQVFFVGSFIVFAWYFRKKSLQEDEEGGTKIHKKNITMSAIFLVIFGYGSSVIAWDWIMSIDAHWFSTLFGWYVFAGMWLTGIVFATVLIYFLRSNGHLQIAKKGHMHDMAKWMFALSFLWTYLFFSQFMLIWYADIPEEVTYYIARIQDYKGIWFGMMLVNFALPMIFLMDADAKMKKGLVVTIGAIIFIFHWFDVYTMVTPGTMKQFGQFGFLEVGMFLLFLGVFVFLVLKSLASRPLVVKNHPYLEESKHIHG
ncbi:MAG: hypothetical protein ACJAZ2_000720 [Glaciecola sp.]|jgi:hypothetical protein